jgi:hypothetical protein
VKPWSCAARSEVEQGRAADPLDELADEGVREELRDLVGQAALLRGGLVRELLAHVLAEVVLALPVSGLEDVALQDPHLRAEPDRRSQLRDGAVGNALPREEEAVHAVARDGEVGELEVDRERELRPHEALHVGEGGDVGQVAPAGALVRERLDVRTVRVQADGIALDERLGDEPAAERDHHPAPERARGREAHLRVAREDPLVAALVPEAGRRPPLLDGPGGPRRRRPGADELRHEHLGRERRERSVPERVHLPARQHVIAEAGERGRDHGHVPAVACERPSAVLGEQRHELRGDLLHRGEADALGDLLDGVVEEEGLEVEQRERPPLPRGGDRREVCVVDLGPYLADAGVARDVLDPAEQLLRVGGDGVEPREALHLGRRHAGAAEERGDGGEEPGSRDRAAGVHLAVDERAAVLHDGEADDRAGRAGDLDGEHRGGDEPFRADRLRRERAPEEDRHERGDVGLMHDGRSPSSRCPAARDTEGLGTSTAFRTHRPRGAH